MLRDVVGGGGGLEGKVGSPCHPTPLTRSIFEMRIEQKNCSDDNAFIQDAYKFKFRERQFRHRMFMSSSKRRIRKFQGPNWSNGSTKM